MRIIIILSVLTLSGWCTDWKQKIGEELSHYGSWSNVLYSLYQEESSLNPWACNTNTLAHGLGQVRAIALREYNRLYETDFKTIDLYDYKINIRISHGLLVRLVDLWDGDIYMVLASYHAGRSRVLKKGVADHQYVKNILGRIKNLTIGNRHTILVK